MTSQRRSLSVVILGLRGIPDVQGGVEAHVAGLARGLVKHGLQVEVVVRSAYGRKGPHVWNGVKVTPLWAPRSRSFEAIVHTAIGLMVIARRAPDVVHIHSIGPALLAPLARLMGARVVVTHHGFDYDRQKWGAFAKAVLRLGERLGMRFANARIGISSEVAVAMQNRYGLPTTFIPNGVEIIVPREGISVLEGMGLVPRRYVLMVARFVPEKRHLDAIAAFARLAYPDLKLVIAGGSEHASRYAERVSAAARAVPNVILVGEKTGEALAQLYSNAALFVLPSSHEGMPIVLIEALGHGLRVLASDIGANCAFGLDPSDYFEMGNVDALTAKMRAKLALPYDEQRAEAQKAAIAAEFDWDHLAELTIGVYDKAISDTPSTRPSDHRLVPPASGTVV